MKSKRLGFTLIELLIVVAIIAILAAIAVPNFLEAQTRSKVSRVKSDMRALATAVESYTVDYNVAPPEAGRPPFPGLVFPNYPGQLQTGILTPAITTPVAYMTNFILWDPFVGTDAAQRPDVRLFTYQAYPWRWPKATPPQPNSAPIQYNEGANLTGAEFLQIYGFWRMFSIGPDKQWTNIGPGFTTPAPVGLPYDATNGTVSAGNIIRSQNEPEQRTWKVF